MSERERYDERDGIYSAWHRTDSTDRYIGVENAQLLGLIDIDATLWVEFHRKSKEPLALIETARDAGAAKKYKCTTVVERLAARCKPTVEAYLLLYTPDVVMNPANPRWPDIKQFRYKKLYPLPQSSLTIASPKEWALFLLKMRQRCAHEIDLTVSRARRLGQHTNGQVKHR